MHAAQIIKACEQLVYLRASLNACTCELWLGVQCWSRVIAWIVVRRLHDDLYQHAATCSGWLTPDASPGTKFRPTPLCKRREVPTLPSCTFPILPCCLSELHSIRACARESRKSYVVYNTLQQFAMLPVKLAVDVTSYGAICSATNRAAVKCR